MKKWLPWIATGVFGLWVLSGLRPPRATSAFDSNGFGRLPTLLNGRVQPLDSVARNTLLILSGRQSVKLESGGRLSATDWLIEVGMKPAVADTRPVFKIDHPELRSLLGLAPEGSLYVAFSGIQSQLEEIEKQSRRAAEVPAERRSSFEKAVLKLNSGVYTYRRLKNSFRPETSSDFAAEVVAFQESLGSGLAAWRLRQEGKPFNAEDLNRMAQHLKTFDFLAGVGYPLLIPPVHPEVKREAWGNLGNSLLETLHSGEVAPPVRYYATMGTAYQQGQAADFNRAVGDYHRWLGSAFAPEQRKAAREFVYNTWRPFAVSLALYLLAFLLGCASWFGWFAVLNRTGFNLLTLGFLVHTAGILFRMFLEGRPPVTNLYSSAVFVGWGAVLLGLVLERFNRDSIGIVMAAMLGLLTQVVAHNLSLDGDTMEMLRAVLDTNFWLATHVITITLGYSAAFVAGFLAILYVVRGVFTRTLTEALAHRLTQMVYGVVCFATLFSFVGTILGGIWADQSWGRFWGWDPKENGALLIVLWCAIILHARWGNLVKERGLMNLAIFGNIITSFSWFGVNMLGVGLHSYGFMDQAFVWLMIFVASQLAVIGLGLLPERHWASRQAAVHGVPVAPQAGAEPA